MTLQQFLLEAEKKLSEATPRPWEYDGSNYIFSGDNHMVAEVRGGGSNQPMDANGELIASAPTLITKLIEICKVHAGALERYSKEGGVKAHNAIAKCDEIASREL